MAFSDSDINSIHQAVFAGDPAVVMDGLTDQTLNPGLQREHRRGASRRYPTVSTLVNVGRAVELSTVNILSAMLLGGAGNIGGLTRGVVAVAASGAPHTSVAIYEAKYADLGAIASGSVHTKYTLARALMLMSSLKVSQGEDGKVSPATADIEITPLSTDGENDPWTVAINQALPTAAAESALYVLSDVVLNGSALPLIRGWTLSPGTKIGTSRPPGALYPKVGFEDVEGSTPPTLTLEFASGAPIREFGLGTQVSGNLVLYLAKCDPVGARVARATEEHISLTIAKGILVPTQNRGGVSQRVSNTVTVEILDDNSESSDPGG